LACPFKRAVTDRGKMARMVRFTEAATQREIFVNPALVRIIMPSTGRGTDIIFDNGHLTTVAESIEAVIRLLDEDG